MTQITVRKLRCESGRRYPFGRGRILEGYQPLATESEIMSTTPLGPISWTRMIRAVEKVRDRLNRAVTALEAAGVSYGVIGGNAVASWVSRVDDSAVRNTRDVDIILARTDLERAKVALAAAGFIYRHVKGIDMFLDGEGTKAGDAVHVLFAGERVRADDLAVAAELSETELTQTDWSVPFRVVSLEALVRMKLTSHRLKDQVHLLDLIGVGLIDAAWPAKFPPELGSRLQVLLDNPDG
jgi:hypothetical protein